MSDCTICEILSNLPDVSVAMPFSALEETGRDFNMPFGRDAISIRDINMPFGNDAIDVHTEDSHDQIDSHDVTVSDILDIQGVKAP